MSRPSLLASFCSSRFHSRTREQLLPPPSAVINNRVGFVNLNNPGERLGQDRRLKASTIGDPDTTFAST